MISFDKLSSTFKKPRWVWCAWIVLVQSMGVLNYRVWQNQISPPIELPPPVDIPKPPIEIASAKIESDPATEPQKVEPKEEPKSEPTPKKEPEPKVEPMPVIPPVIKLDGNVMIVVVANDRLVRVSAKLKSDLASITDKKPLLGQKVWISGSQGIAEWPLADAAQAGAVEPFDASKPVETQFRETLENAIKLRESATNPDFAVLLLWANDKSADKLGLNPDQLRDVIKRFSRISIVCIGTPVDGLDPLYQAFDERNVATVEYDSSSYWPQINQKIKKFKIKQADVPPEKK